MLFSAPMVNAILEGRKTETRRVVMPLPQFTGASGDSWEWHGGKVLQRLGYGAPYVHTDQASMLKAIRVATKYQPGATIWVRETWFDAWAWEKATGISTGIPDHYLYRANFNLPDDEKCKWKPSLFMPREACRITLQIEAVQVERLQDITKNAVHREGAVLRMHSDKFGNNPVSAFDQKVYQSHKVLWASGWNMINLPRKGCSWAANPFVYVISFRRLS